MKKPPNNACKYPRTPHLPWCPGVSSDDRVLKDILHFEMKNVIVTEKMDGECTSIYRDYIHARSLDSATHLSQSWVRNFHSQIKHRIDPNLRICGENLYAKHSVSYESLPSFFMVFSIWSKDECLSWIDTEEICNALGLVTVPVITAGIWDLDGIENKCQNMKSLFTNEENHEGFCVRMKASYLFTDHEMSVAKYVRKNHVQTDEHWKKNWRDIPEMRNLLRKS